MPWNLTGSGVYTPGQAIQIQSAITNGMPFIVFFDKGNESNRALYCVVTLLANVGFAPTFPVVFSATQWNHCQRYQNTFGQTTLAFLYFPDRHYQGFQQSWKFYSFT